MNSRQAANTTPARNIWDDPLLLDEQMSADERMIRDAANAYCQERLASRVLEAIRHKKTNENRREQQNKPKLCGLRSDRARCRARRFRLPLDDERAILSGHAADT